MSRVVRSLYNDADRKKVSNWLWSAPDGTRVELKAPKRTVPQSDKMYAMLSDVASQVKYHGLKLSVQDYKLLFLDALNRETRMIPNLDGNGFVSLGRSSSDLSKQEMSDLIELIAAWGAQNGVVFRDPWVEQFNG